MDVGEQDYHNLKRDQRLVVDFAGFSKKFIDLINCCMRNPQESYSSTYLAKLDFNTSIFSIVEVNQFNHLIHLCLQFRPGNDTSIKAYLSSTLQLSLIRSAALQSEVDSLHEECSGLSVRNRELTTDLRNLR